MQRPLLALAREASSGQPRPHGPYGTGPTGPPAGYSKICDKWQRFCLKTRKQKERQEREERRDEKKGKRRRDRKTEGTNSSKSVSGQLEVKLGSP